MAPPASPSAHRDGLRSASRAHPQTAPSDDASQIRAALRAIYHRFDDYKERARELEAQSNKTLTEYEAETANLLQGWSTQPGFTAAHVELQLQARNAEYRIMESQRDSRQARNRICFEGELGSILKDIVARDELILKTKDDAGEAMAVDEPPVVAPEPPVVAPSPTTRKRARETDSPRATSPESPSVKRPKRTATPRRRAAESGRPSVSGSQVRTPASGNRDNGMGGRTITFDEIYQGGKAQHKHAIVTHPSVPGFLILKCECDDHTVHFGGPKSVLQGAAKHLDTAFHQMKRSYEGAIKHLGWEVLGCDSEKAAANNAVVEKALAQGYRPVNSRWSGGRKSVGGSAPKPPVEAEPSKSTRITRANGGELYYAWWPDDEKYYLCMVIPWDNTKSGDFGLTEIRKGVHGLGLLDRKVTRVPNCYTIDCDLDPPRITGWAEGYEDGGPKESKRLFPTLFFHPPRNLASWTKASFLRPFDWRRPNFDVPGHKLDPRSVDRALEAMAKARGFSSFADFAAAQGSSAAAGSADAASTSAQSEVRDKAQGGRESLGLGHGEAKEGGRHPAADMSTSGGSTEGDTEGASTPGVSTPGDVTGETQARAPSTVAADSTPPAKAPTKAVPADKGPAVGDKAPAGTPANGTAAVATAKAPTKAAPPSDKGPAAHGNAPAGTPANGTAADTASSVTTSTPQPSKKGAPPTAPPSTASPAITQKAQNDAPPNGAKPLLVRRSQSGTKAPTMAATPPATPAAESRAGGASTARAPTKMPTELPPMPPAGIHANLPPKPPSKSSDGHHKQLAKVNDAKAGTPTMAKAMATEVSNVMRGAQPPATAAPGQTPVAKQAPKGAPKSDVQPQKAVDSQSSKAPAGAGSAGTPGQPPPVAKEPAQSAAKGTPTANTSSVHQKTVDGPSSKSPAGARSAGTPGQTPPVAKQPPRGAPQGKISGVRPPKTADSFSLKGAAGARSAGTPGQTAPPASQPSKQPQNVKAQEAHPQQSVNSPAGAVPSKVIPGTGCLKAAVGTRSPAPPPGQPPPSQQAAQKAPANSATPALRLQTQVGPSRSNLIARGSPVASASASPARSFTSSPTPRNATIATREPSRYYVSEYEGPDTFWHAANDSERLVLEVDASKEIVRTGEWQLPALEIAPIEITRKLVTSHTQLKDRPEPGKHTLTLNMRDKATGEVREHRLVFDQHGGVAASRHARAFFRWVSDW